MEFEFKVNVDFRIVWRGFELNISFVHTCITRVRIDSLSDMYRNKVDQ